MSASVGRISMCVVCTVFCCTLVVSEIVHNPIRHRQISRYEGHRAQKPPPHAAPEPRADKLEMKNNLRVENLTSSQITATSVRLRWDVSGNESFPGYRIEHEMMDSETVRVRTSDIYGEFRSYTLKGLYPKTRYRVCVMPLMYSAVGLSSPIVIHKRKQCVVIQTKDETQDNQEMYIQIGMGCAAGLLFLLVLCAIFCKWDKDLGKGGIKVPRFHPKKLNKRKKSKKRTGSQEELARTPGSHHGSQNL
ncbi:leucine-rich repeat neuronal protein 4-like isoform X2 [Branchiostoma floridae x Branchiostoma japonicum]